MSGINLAWNYGQHNALLCGIRRGKFDVLVTMDDDLQNPPEEIPKLLQKLDEGYDVVYGVPLEEQHGAFFSSEILPRSSPRWQLRAKPWERKSHRTLCSASSVSGVSIAFAHYRGSFVSIDALMTWGDRSLRGSASEARLHAGPACFPGYSVGKLIASRFQHTLLASVSCLCKWQAYWVLPSRCLGSCFYPTSLGRYFLQGSSVPGFLPLASMIAIFSGAQLFALGVTRLYTLPACIFRTMERPAYAVSETTSTGEDQKENSTHAATESNSTQN